MDRKTYNEICESVYKHKGKKCLELVCKDFSRINTATLTCIEFQLHQSEMKRTHYWHTSPEMISRYYERYLDQRSTDSDDILLNLAYDVDFSPALLAKVVVEKYLSDKNEGPFSKTLHKYMHDPATIPDPLLAANVHKCLIYDFHYGMVSNSIKESNGHAYELKLKCELTARNVPFIDENRMRDDGYDKTPDVKLEIPIAVDGVVINWIESKALFGDDAYHARHMKEQIWSYWNRFGSGMIIYWMGFISDLNNKQDKGIVLMDSFPTDITYMNPSLKPCP